LEKRYWLTLSAICRRSLSGRCALSSTVLVCGSPCIHQVYGPVLLNAFNRNPLNISRMSHHHYSFINFVRRQVFCFGVGQGWTGTMGFVGSLLSPLAVSSDLVPASAMGTQRLGQPSAYPLLHQADQLRPYLVQTRPTPTLAFRLAFPRSPQRSSARMAQTAITKVIAVQREPSCGSGCARLQVLPLSLAVEAHPRSDLH
jgi:hypothetical protein